MMTAVIFVVQTLCCMIAMAMANVTAIILQAMSAITRLAVLLKMKLLLAIGENVAM